MNDFKEKLDTNLKNKGKRYNKGKNRLGLIPAWAEYELGKVYTKGADKYTIFDDNGNVVESGDDNWLKGLSWKSVLHSLKRHLNAYEQGKDYDFDPNCEKCINGNCLDHTGLYHMAQVTWNALTLLQYYKSYPQGDDRVKPYFNIPKIGLDIDEVLADWVGAWKERWDITNVPSSWYFDREILNRFDYMKETDELDNFYLNLKPLINPTDLKFVPHCYITSRPVDSKITEMWLDKNGFPTRPVYTVGTNKSKVDVAKESGIDIFIDDSWDNFIDLNKNGVTCYLFDRPHNQYGDVGHLRIKDLNNLEFI